MVLLSVRPRGGTPGWHALGRETFLAPVEWAHGWPVAGEVAAELPAPARELRGTFISKGVPVHLGEYGLLTRPTDGAVEHGEMMKYYEELGYQARVSGVTTALWDGFAFLDRAELKWRGPEVTTRSPSPAPR